MGAIHFSVDLELVRALRHYVHQTRFSRELWLQNGEHFLALIERLRADPGNHAAGVLEELAAAGGELPARLDRISSLICKALP